MEYICGINAVYEALRAKKRRVSAVYIVEGKGAPSVEKICALAQASGIKVTPVARQKIFDLTRVETNQGIAAEVESFKYLFDVEDLLSVIAKKKEPPFIIILDQVSDPHNLGAVIRTAHQMGVHGIVIPKDNSVSVTPSAAKAASGAVEYIPIVKVTNINAAIKVLKDNNIWVVGAEGDCEKNIYQYDFTTGTAIVLGGEGKGLRRLVKEHCDELLRIPTTGQIDSLNVSVAGAIFMSEVMRQRLSKNRAETA